MLKRHLFVRQRRNGRPDRWKLLGRCLSLGGASPRRRPAPTDPCGRGARQRKPGTSRQRTPKPTSRPSRPALAVKPQNYRAQAKSTAIGLSVPGGSVTKTRSTVRTERSLQLHVTDSAGTKPGSKGRRDHGQTAAGRGGRQGPRARAHGEWGGNPGLSAQEGWDLPPNLRGATRFCEREGGDSLGHVRRPRGLSISDEAVLEDSTRAMETGFHSVVLHVLRLVRADATAVREARRCPPRGAAAVAKGLTSPALRDWRGLRS